MNKISTAIRTFFVSAGIGLNSMTMAIAEEAVTSADSQPNDRTELKSQADVNKLSLLDQAGDRVQGEYVGLIIAGGTRYPIGIRILALGDDQYRSVAYVGGLPVAGKDAGRKIVTESERDEDGTLTFRSDRSVTTWRDGRLNLLLGDRSFEFKKFERRSPTLGKQPPKHALVLFDGESLTAWSNGTAEHDCLMPGAITKQSFGDFRMHIEFWVPLEPAKEVPARGNSGVVIQDKFELQILDSFGLEAKHEACGGIVNIKRPDANVSTPAQTWQTFDIEFAQAQQSAEGQLVTPPLVTVRHNGIYIHREVELPWDELTEVVEAPIRLEDGDSRVLFRNVWLVEE